MLDTATSGRPGCRSALIAHELSRLNIDIAALSEVRLHEEGHSDCIISLRLPLYNKQHDVLFSIYVPTLQADPAEKDKFYSDLCRLTQKVPIDDKFIILDLGDHRGFYEALKAVYGPTFQVQSPLRSADGQMLLTDKISILNRWSKHFQTLFSANRVVQGKGIQHILEHLVKNELDIAPTMGETLKAIQQVKTVKAAGVDGIPPEIWKHGGQALHAKFHELVVRCWEQGKLPSDFCDAIIITLYKKKGMKSDCSRYRGITLLSIAGKLLARILLNRLIPAITEELLPESQCGFRANRSTTNMVVVLGQLQEKCREENKGLYVTFIDLTKAFDTVSRKGLWLILELLGCPPKFLKRIILL
ncbi:uncharacterized protein LOC136017496 [Lathamus discolor]|uniref:uncharacterized protein LOC136017496 n=1 Tax=Lathamus discolor TaxID=678569 RepID=UPI0032B8522E